MALLALDEAPGHLLRRCHQRSREIFEALIGHRGVSREQLAVLIALARNAGAHDPRSNLTGIVAASGFDRNTLAEMLVRLERMGFVARRRSARDRRAYEIALTPKGARFVAEMMPLAHAVQRRIMAPLPPALRPLFLHCLRILLALDAPAGAGDALARMRPGRPCAPLLPEPEFGRDDAKRLRALEESMWRRETRYDRDYMDRTLAPDFFEFGRSGRVYTRADIIGMRPGPTSRRFRLRDFKVTPLGTDVALVTYVSEVKAKGGQRGNRSSVWLKAPTGWQLSFHQATAVFPQGTVSD